MSDGTVLSKCLAGGVGCGIAGLITNPLDVIKIRNQQYGSTHPSDIVWSDPRYRTFLGTASSIFHGEGVRGFGRGASASVLRECTYSALRMGLYEPIKARYSAILLDDGETSTSSPSSSPLVKWMSAFTSGAIGSALFNPVDLVKVRYQSARGRPPYSSLPDAFRAIYAEEGGWRGLYAGTSATVVRAAFLTSAQLGSYDVIKNDVLVDAFSFDGDSTSTHLCASAFASAITATAANPPDVVKTRVMNDPRRTVGGPCAHFLHVMRTDGISGFMRGWTASYLRIGPHTVISLVLIEKIRQGIGMASY
ncbi:hypothetical protein ACHAW5_010439 [Stephanodiscus triporus]|uniref:Mitochondrial carrier protein n=1 Tax=Stephanodiscus triporus TaxID=2934178 RepID=A0ABD3MMG9_9STRA